MTHFVIPWTRGTGTSIALLMNAAEQVDVEITLSRSWAGPSVAETHVKLKRLVDGGDSSVPAHTRVFFSALCLCYAQDEMKPWSVPVDAQIDSVLAAFFGRGAQFVELARP